VPETAQIRPTVQRISTLAETCQTLASNSIVDNHVELFNGTWFNVDDSHSIAVRRPEILDLIVILDADRMSVPELTRAWMVGGEKASLIVARKTDRP